MSDFDPNDIIAVQKPQAAVPKADFAPEDVLSVPAVNASSGSDFDKQDVLSLEHPEGGSVQQPSGPGRTLSQEDLDAVAAKHGVSPEELSNVAPYFSMAFPTKMGLGESIAKQTAGTAGRYLGSIPQLIYRKSQEPKMRAAIDELQQIGEEQRGPIMSLTEAAIGPAKVFKTASVPLRIAEGAAIGAGYGAGAAREGQEVRGAKQGAIIGTALTTAGEGLTKLLGAGKFTKSEEALVRGRQADVEAGIDRVAGETKGSEDILQELTFGKQETITPQQAKQIAEEQYGQDSIKEFLDPSTPKGEVIRHQINGPATDDAILKHLADSTIEGRAKEFATDLGLKPKNAEEAIGLIQEHAARQGVEGTVNQYRNFVNLKQAERAIEDMGAVAKSQPGFWGSVVNKVSDNQYVLRHLDDKYGINSEAILRDLNKARNRLTFARSETRKDLGIIHDLAVKNGSDGAVVNTGRIYDALDSGDFSRLTPEETKTANAFSAYFQKGREYANDLVRARDPNIAPLNIPKVENYVPHGSIPVQDQIPLIEKRLTEAEQQLGRRVQDLTGRELHDLAEAPGPVQDLVAFNNWADNSASTANGRELVQQIEEKLHTREGNIALESKARSAMERQGEIPDFVRQKNLYKLADSWAHNTYNHLYLRNSLDRLTKEAKKLEALGAQVEADYVNRIVQDSLGIRKGTAAEGFMQARIGSSRKLDSTIDKYGRTSPIGVALTGAKNVPDILYGLMRNIYPNLLGFGNMYAATQNLVTGFTRLAPELGTRYGYSTVLRGAAKTLLNFREYYQAAEKLGNVPANVIREGESAIAEGLFRSKTFNLSKAGYQKLAEFGMKLFESSEKFNRALTIGVADMMAADLARGSNSAIGSLRKFPLSIQKQIMRNPSSIEENSRLLGQYLNDTTQFNYNRSSLFEYGRTLGPVLATFSKWPTAILGEAAYTYRSQGIGRGTLRNMERLVAPYVLLQAVDYAMGERDDDPDALSDRMKKFVGSHGMSAMSPVNALHGFVTGEIFTPPAVDLVMKGLIVPAFSGDTEKLGKGLDTALRNYAPGSGLLRFVTDDMVTYITGHRPEGSTFIERTQEGLRKLEK